MKPPPVRKQVAPGVLYGYRDMRRLRGSNSPLSLRRGPRRRSRCRFFARLFLAHYGRLLHA